MLEMIARFADGDARRGFNLLEMAVTNGQIEGDRTIVTREILEHCLGKKSLLYDKKGEEHYNLISALHKSHAQFGPGCGGLLAGPDAGSGGRPAVYRQTADSLCQRGCGYGGQPGPCLLAVAAYQACHFLGDAGVQCEFKPYGDLSVHGSQVQRRLCGLRGGKEGRPDMLAEPVPLNIRNAPTGLMKELHYGEGYVYAHDTKAKMARMQCLPDSLTGRT